MAEKNKLKIEYVAIGSIKLNPKNPRKNDEAVDKISGSIEQFDFTNPILVRKANKVIIAGHTRFKAAKKLGIKEVPVVFLDMTEKQADAYMLADNKLNELATWDDAALAKIIADLQSQEIDVTTLGFPQDEIDALLSEFMPNQAGLTDEDAIPEVPKPISKAGDLWLLGNHRLLCGDSTKPEDVARLMDGQKADMVFTDPPYGVDYGEKNRFLNSFQPSGRNLKDIANDVLGKDKLFTLLQKAFTLAYEHGKDHCSYYVTAPQNGELGLMMMMMMMMMSGLPTRHVLIWNKNRQNFSLGRLDYEYKHEPILYTWKKKHVFYGKGEFKNSVWDIDKELKCDKHPTMKPIALIENALLNSSLVNNNVLDLFLGSGSTLIACEKLNRRCFGCEIDPHYVDVIVKRCEDFTGKKAVLAK